MPLIQTDRKWQLTIKHDSARDSIFISKCGPIKCIEEEHKIDITRQTFRRRQEEKDEKEGKKTVPLYDKWMKSTEKSFFFIYTSPDAIRKRIVVYIFHTRLELEPWKLNKKQDLGLSLTNYSYSFSTHKRNYCMKNKPTGSRKIFSADIL